jgi:hypothetical protein
VVAGLPKERKRQLCSVILAEYAVMLRVLLLLAHFVQSWMAINVVNVIPKRQYIIHQWLLTWQHIVAVTIVAALP